MIVSKKSALALVAFLATSVHAHGRGQSLMLGRRGYNYNNRYGRSPSIDLMSDMFSLPVYFNSLFQQQQASRHLQQSEPTYTVQTLPNGDVELSVDVPGVARNDLTVELVDNGTTLRISGSRKQRDSVTEFDQIFRLEKDLDVDNLSVRLADGVLTITAPKKEKVVKRLQIAVPDDEQEAIEVQAEVVSDAEGDNDGGEEERQEVDGMTITTEKD